jgi:hypothetical protein
MKAVDRAALEVLVVVGDHQIVRLRSSGHRQNWQAAGGKSAAAKHLQGRATSRVHDGNPPVG